MVQLRALYPESLETTYTYRTCDCRRSSRPIRHKPALNEPPQHQGDGARLPRREESACRTESASRECRSAAIAEMRFPSQVHKEVNMVRRSLMLVVGVGLAMLGSSIAWSEDSDQAALIKALDGAKLTLLQGIAQVAKGTEVPIEAKYQMVRGKLMLSIYTSAKGFDTAAEDNSFNEYIG